MLYEIIIKQKCVTLYGKRSNIVGVGGVFKKSLMLFKFLF